MCRPSGALGFGAVLVRNNRRTKIYPVSKGRCLERAKLPVFGRECGLKASFEGINSYGNPEKFNDFYMVKNVYSGQIQNAKIHQMRLNS
jgi:hypothetical protein